MSKRQLRSKRRTASPSELKVPPGDEGPSNKRPKKRGSKSASDSDSSSDDFVLPSNELKVNTKGIPRNNELSIEPDFTSIEKSIFAGVSKLSDSESDNSDFEEVSITPQIVDASLKETNLSCSLPMKNEDCVEPSSLRSSKRIQNSQRKSKDVKITEDVKPRAGPAKSTRRTTSGKPEGQTTKSKDDRGGHNTVAPIKTTRASTSSLDKNAKGGKKSVENEKSANTSRKRNLKKEKEINQLPVKSEVPDSVDNLDIAQLLALGEGLKMESKSSEPSDSGSEEWEEVDPNDIKQHEFPKEGVQITVNAPEFNWRRKKQRDQQACLEAEMNRAFNRVRKELQLLCHKTSLLLWLAHGIFVNKVINTDCIRAIALSLIPRDLTAMPKGPCKRYVDQLLKWFTSEFECSEGFPETLESGQSRNLVTVLEQHFSRRYAKSTRELTFMFVTILRIVGMESRLIISFQPVPLKPQSDTLLAVNRKNGKSKRSRLPNKHSESEDDPAPQSQQAEKTSKYFTPTKSQDKASVKSTKQNAASKDAGDAGPNRVGKSGPSGTKPDLPKKENTEGNCRRGRKPDTGSAKSPPKSPPKTRQLRQKNSGKIYKEKSDSENETSDEEADIKPILSPDKKKVDDKSLSERLKAAAAKRLPANKRKSDLSRISTAKSKSSGNSGKAVRDSDESDFEPKPKRNSQTGNSKKSVSPQKPSTSRRSISQKSNSDSDFETTPKQRSSGGSKTPVKRRQSKCSASKGKGKKVLSSDDESGKKLLAASGSDYWIEVYLKDEDKWACIDVPSKKVDSTAAVLAKATQPVCYVLAFNVEGTVKDVTKRYSPRFSQVTVKQRVSADWWDKSLRPFKPKHTKREATEDSEMNLVELDRPMPKSVGECKNHPLYVLKRHLLKFEAIYPPDSPSLGFVRNEAIYARQNVYRLRSRETWMKDGKVVKLGEQPYKVVTQPKWDKINRKILTGVPLEVFGPWQVEDYVPPPAVDGKVPRNAYGNVELFKPTMLPGGCVHLQVPGLSRVAKKLRIDCAPAIVGFDFHSGGVHPTYDGFVVCEENVDALMDAWNKEIDESAKRREEKHEKRVYGNWKRLIKGLLIREQLKYRYDFIEEGQKDAASGQSTVNADVLQASRIPTESAPLPLLFPKLMANIRNGKSQQTKSAVKGKKSQTKPQTKKKGPKPKSTRKRKDETSEEEESAWDSSTTEEDDSEMVLLSDEDSGSEFENLKK
ncbi:hypothetical protein ONE63_002834 [Megalurothrips usitatus]|uniref:DNA repair protein complementing XP-C cells homolog n=1 Tax=Megalurothrips usitatus TaxID=439358 RepID=A0AAV7X5G9_9NEOP|nr:hypothetical protein ONE63_002834 [Megalurothrips usitatus]